MNIKVVVAVVFCLFFSLFVGVFDVNASEDNIQDIAEYPANPRLVARDHFSGGDNIESRDLKLENLSLNIDLFAGYARTEVSATFFNPTDRDLEAMFEMQLPEHSELTGFALDVDGKMIPGVLLGKDKAKRVFNSRVRATIDPGLAELTRTNLFKNRVYPVPANGARTISLNFVSKTAGQNFILPILSDGPIKQFSVNINTDSKEIYSVNGLNLKKINHKDTKNKVSALGKNVKVDTEIEVKAIKNLDSFVETNSSGQHFLRTTLPLQTAERKTPKNITVFWDRSLSMLASAQDNFNALAKLKETHSEVSFSLQGFNHRQDVKEAGLSFSDLLTSLKQFEYGGATDLTGLRKAMSSSVADECWVFTDGDMNFGASTTLQGAPNCRPVFFGSGIDINESLLVYLAKQTQGVYINIDKTTDLLDELERPVIFPSKLLVNNVDASEEAEWQVSGEDLNIIIPLSKRSEKVDINIGNKLITISLAQLTTYSKRLVSPFWAQKRLAMLREQDISYDALVEFSRKYSVVTKETSFLVLESVEEYAENELPLPRSVFSRKQKKQYRELLDEVKAKQETEQEERLGSLISAWSEQKEWYVTDHAKRMRKQEMKRRSNVQAESSSEPSPAPPQSFDMFSGASEDEIQEVVVTGARRSDSNQSAAKDIDMQLNTWKPERAYLWSLQDKCSESFMQNYLELRKQYGDKPSFYLETADQMADCEDAEATISILLSALELAIMDDQTVTAVAQRLLKYGAYQDAVQLFELAVKQNETSPQALRNLALAIERSVDDSNVDKKEKVAEYQRALNYLNDVIMQPWNASDDGIEMISLMEANRIITKLKALGDKNTILHKELVKVMSVDLRILIAWNVDIVDMDLWVVEPNGEKSFYSNPMTAIGGRLSNDMTDGLGPEEYLLKDAPKGEYEIFVHYYSSDVISPNGPVTVSAKIFRNWGMENEESSTLDLEFTNTDEKEYSLGKITVH